MKHIINCRKQQFKSKHYARLFESSVPEGWLPELVGPRCAMIVLWSFLAAGYHDAGAVRSVNCASLETTKLLAVPPSSACTCVCVSSKNQAS